MGVSVSHCGRRVQEGAHVLSLGAACCRSHTGMCNKLFGVPGMAGLPGLLSRSELPELVVPWCLTRNCNLACWVSSWPVGWPGDVNLRYQKWYLPVDLSLVHDPIVDPLPVRVSNLGDLTVPCTGGSEFESGADGGATSILTPVIKQS